MGDKLKLWFYPEVDYLEVTFSEDHGYMRPTNSDAVMKRVDEEGRLIGFSVFGVSRFQKDHPLEVELVPRGDEASRESPPQPASPGEPAIPASRDNTFPPG